MNGENRRVLLLPHIRVQNANALSSPFTIGFPAMTAWLGAVHALQRRLNAVDLVNVNFCGVAVISHDIELQTKIGKGDFVHSIVVPKRPPSTRKELTGFIAGSAPSFIEHARCHLDVSLLIEYVGINKDDEQAFIEQVTHHLNTSMKIAGGDILSFQKPMLYRVEEGIDTELQKLIRKLMPGYAIVERRDLLIEAMEQGRDVIDAMLDYLAVHYHCERDDEGNVTWTSSRKTSGWIVPIATGFHGITELGHAINQRDPDIPHRFAESVVTLGEFCMPHLIHSLDDILWHYRTDMENNLYLCQQGDEPE
ncbi:type I-F CRISPR-associated protein Csy2 [candidate division CSSED10-310 bacterium]|uniref:Type I-F CRISPR-associated protein Csy2 n=1 Tax=candidate division CSSED10-310 bacterium TaxID=2855610 RepID=A0ABV6YZV3_UNCC1